MVNKAKARKRQGLETAFTVGGQPWSMDRIERSAKRAKSEGMEAGVIGMCPCAQNLLYPSSSFLRYGYSP